MYEITSGDRELYENETLTLKGLVKAYREQDPRLAEYLIKLVIIDPAPQKKEGDSMKTLNDYSEFRKKYHKDAVNRNILRQIKPAFPRIGRNPHQVKRQKRAQLFTERFEELLQRPETIPERLKVGEFILALYDEEGEYARAQLIEILRHVPLKWGPWLAFKQLLKRGCIDQRWVVFSIVYNRWYHTPAGIKTSRNYRGELVRDLLPLDMEDVNWSDKRLFRRRAQINEITTETRIFMRKATNRILSEQFDTFDTATKEDIVSEVLTQVDSFKHQGSSWWNPASYDNSDFWAYWTHKLPWTSRSEPVMRVFQKSRNAKISDWALNMLIKNHENALVELPVEWIVSNATGPKTSKQIRTFVVNWFTKPITKTPKADFFNKGLHKAILAFLFGYDKDYRDNTSLMYAIEYIQQFMEVLSDDISLDQVLWMLRHKNTEIHRLGKYLLFPDGETKSPYIEQLDFAFWTDLLGDARMHDDAVRAITQHFPIKNLTKAWYVERLKSKSTKVIDQALQWIQEKNYVDTIDFYDVYLDFIYERLGDSKKLQMWSWEQLNVFDEQGKRPLDRFTDQDYRNLLFHRQKEYREFVFEAYKSGKITLDTLSLPILKNVVHHKDFERYNWEDELDAGRYRQRRKLSSDVSEFARSIIFNKLDLTVADLGYVWVLNRINTKQRNYAFIDKLFDHQFPISHLVGLTLRDEMDEAELEQTLQSLEGSDENVQKGCKAVVDILLSEYPESRKAKFWRTFLRSRLVRYRKMFMPEKSELSPECVFPSSFFSMDWFNKQVGSFDKPTRAFGIEIASLYLKEWISRQTFGFRALKPLLFSRHQDVRKFILRAIKNPASEHEYIDITHADFKPEELYEFCLDSNSLIRVTGMEIIQQYPERFGQPDKLIMLASSDDASVRALVVRTIWDLVFISDVTYDWQPTAESVLPQAAKAGAKGYINPIEQLPPSKDAPQVKGVKYLGKGTSQQRTLKLESYTELEDFVRRQLFRLPPNRAGESNAELRARKESGMPPLSPGRIPSWQDKKRLMRIIRDMSIKDKNLATQMVPLFKEFLLFKGKFLKHEALTALVRIEKAHDISIFS